MKHLALFLIFCVSACTDDSATLACSVPKPTLSPAWDTGAVNAIAPLAGHVSSGFATNEVPTSAELNEWMRRVGIIGDYIIAGDLELDGMSLPSADVAIPNSLLQTLTPAASVVVNKLTGGGSTVSVKGISGGTTGRILIYRNGTSNNVTFNVLDSGAGAGQAVAVYNLVTTQQVNLTPGQTIVFRYDGTQWNTLWCSIPLGPVEIQGKLTLDNEIAFTTYRTADVPLNPATVLTNCNYSNVYDIGSTNPTWLWKSQTHGSWGLRTGDRIRIMNYTLTTAGAGSYTFVVGKIAKWTTGATLTVIDSWTESAVGGSIGVSGGGVHAIASPAAIADGERWWVSVAGPNAGDVLTNVFVQYDRP